MTDINTLLSGETGSVEYKLASGGIPQSIWETYSSFANTSGGFIVLCKKEKKGTFSVEGIDNPSALVTDFWNTLNNHQKVSENILLDSNVTVQQTDGKNVIVIEVPRAERISRPVYINDNLFGGTYRRNGEGDYRCSKEEVKAMLRDQAETTVDGRIIENLLLSDLNTDSVRGYRNMFRLSKQNHVWNSLSDDAFLLKIGAAKKGSDGKVHPTLAGLVFFGDFVTIMGELPNYFLDYREYLTSDIRWTDRVCSSDSTWSGNIFDFYFRIINRLTADIKIPFKIENGLRVDETQMHSALREALANALIHADYYGRRGIVIDKTPHTITLRNPGIFRISVTEAISGGVSDARNSYIFNMFSLIDVGERSGTGLCNLYGLWQLAHIPAPKIEESFNPDTTTVTIDVADFIVSSEEKGEVIEEKFIEKEESSQKSSQKIITMIQSNSGITTQEMADSLGISRRAVAKQIAALQEKNIIRRIGADKGGHWEVIE